MNVKRMQDSILPMLAIMYTNNPKEERNEGTLIRRCKGNFKTSEHRKRL
jgi:hypothetical protein